jgi:anaerobic selenocysteine-containing dehydrogenase
MVGGVSDPKARMLVSVPSPIVSSLPLPLDTVLSACPHDCPSTCALEVERLGPDRIGKVRGGRHNPYTAGVICAKVARYADRVHHPDRLTQPMLRVGEKGVGRAAFRPIGWEDALDLLAERFLQAAQRHGPETVFPYFYAGTMGLVQRDGIERLRHVMGYSRQASTICVALADAGWTAGAGVKRGLDGREIGDADLVVMWGGNPVNTQVNVMTHIARARKERGAKLIVIDPYRTGTAEQADLHLMLRPGTDGALAAAVIHVLFRDGFADRAYMARYTDAPQELERHVATRTPDWAAAITGLDPQEIERFAHLYGSTRRSFLRLGYGFTRSRNGAANMHAASCLPAVTGAWQHPGGGALYSNSGMYRLDRSLIEGLDRLDPSVRRLDQSRLGPILTGDKRDLGDGPPVTALLVQNTNPMMVCPEHIKVREGFSRPDLFVAVHEQFMTETAMMADLVLPATTFLEHDDFYIASGHTFLQVGRKAIEPVGQARSNHDLLCGLAQRLGADHPGFRMSAWEIIEATFAASGLPDPATVYEQGGLDCAPDFETRHFLNGFGHPDGKFRFRPDWSGLGPGHERMPALPDHMPVIEEADPDHPFRLVTAPARSFLNSTFTETAASRAREGRPTALVHPQDCARLGIVEDSLVRLSNRRGSVLVHARPFGGLQPGVLVVESIWPNGAFVGGIGINALTSADPGYPAGGAVFHDTAVALAKA